MSAMFVSRHDIDLLVSAMREMRSLVRLGALHDHADRIDPNALGRMLWAENVKSLRHLYPTERDEHRAFDREVQAYAPENTERSGRARLAISPSSTPTKPASIPTGAQATPSSRSANFAPNW